MWVNFYLHVVLCYDPQKVDVVVGVKTGHVLAADRLRPKHLHLTVQTVVNHQVVCHTNTVWFHGVPLAVVIVPDLGCQWRKQGHEGTLGAAEFCVVVLTVGKYTSDATTLF